jgi:hypothetical protein
MRELGIEFISVFGLPPVDFVHTAADLGCRYISIALIGRPLESLGYPVFSLKDDAWRRRNLLHAMDDRGGSISLGEGMVIVPGANVSDLALCLFQCCWFIHSDTGPRCSRVRVREISASQSA